MKAKTQTALEKDKSGPVEMSWFAAIFPNWHPTVINSELCDHSDESLDRQTVQYGSLESGVIKDKRRSSEISRGKMPGHLKNSSFASNSSLLGLLQEHKEKNDWRVIPNVSKIVIRQPERDSPSILPFYNGKSKLHSHTEAPIQGEYIETIKTQFFNLGISTGASLQLFLVSFLLMFASASTNEGPIRELSHEYYPVFRGILLISFFFSLYGANIFIWRRSKVDYLQVIGASYTHTYQYVLRGSTSMAYITFTMFMCYFLSLSTLDSATERSHTGSNLRHLWPALAVLLPILLFLCPWDGVTAVCYGVKRNGFKQRWGLLHEVACVLVSPFSKVTFLRCFIADIFCSMPRIFTDLQYTICLYATGSFLSEEPDDQGISDIHQHAYHTCGAGSRPYYILQIALGFLPYFIRFCQSMRAYSDTKNTVYLWNALKYGLSLTVTGLAVAHNAAKISGAGGQLSEYRYVLSVSWIVVGIATSLYSFYWDVVMDWGLGHRDSRNYFLRDEISFTPDKYYVSIGLDFFMRLGWVFVISPEQQYLQQNYMMLLSAVELVRRFLWSIYRVEWESIQQAHKTAAKNAKTKHDRLAGLYYGNKPTLNFSEHKNAVNGSMVSSKRSSRSSLRSDNTSNTALSVFSELEDRGDEKYANPGPLTRPQPAGDRRLIHANSMFSRGNYELVSTSSSSSPPRRQNLFRDGKMEPITLSYQGDNGGNEPITLSYQSGNGGSGGITRNGSEEHGPLKVVLSTLKEDQSLLIEEIHEGDPRGNPMGDRIISQLERRSYSDLSLERGTRQ